MVKLNLKVSRGLSSRSNLLEKAGKSPAASGAGVSVRKGIKQFTVLLVLLFMLGLAGLFLGLSRINDTYKQNKDTLNILADEVNLLEKKVSLNVFKNKNYDFLQYKVNAFTKRYSQFSYILDSVYSKSQEYGFQPDLVLSIVKVESNYNPKAVSYVGACGLMQVNVPVWRKELNIDSQRVFDVDYNIDLGLRILKQYYDESNGNLKRALHLYNNGYLHNNTKYTGKVDKAFKALRMPSKLNLTLSGYKP
ncbi:MAG: lytic transglycosylase domain-containing protein [bacterium]|nr:lytic transglycosylase domain-containing protein [bacterium]